MMSMLLVRRNARIAMAVLLLVGGWLASALIGAEAGRTYNANQKEFYLDQKDIEYIRPGLQVEIQNAEVQGTTVLATVRLTDDQGVPLDRRGILTPGPVELNFVLARIKRGERQYTAYTTSMEANPDTGQLFTMGHEDSGGTFEDKGDGVSVYTFGTRLPSDFDPAVTHTVGIYAARDLSGYGLTNYVAAAVYNFVPSGGEVTVVRDVVRTENCNRCHDPLSAHEGTREDVRLCILCHNPASSDAVTGKTIDMKVIIHKIHRGVDLPSVKAGQPFIIEEEDFSEVKFPQDIRNCTVCHQKGTQSDNYKNKPGRVACGACHDDVNFATGENHGAGGVQVDDSECTLCHAPDTGREFDISITGAHTVPWKSKQLPGLNPEILSVDGAVPGGRPTVVFKITDNSGAMVDPSTLDLMRLGMGGPNNNSVFGLKEDATHAKPVSGGYSYQFEAALPRDAAGTWVVATEMARDLTLTKVDGNPITVREAPNNQLFFIPITGSATVRRRPIVSNDNCNVCHERLAVHDDSRQNVEYCPTCHRPGQTDEEGRPADQLPAETLEFKNLIHKIHSGHHLANDFTIYDEGAPENFNEVHFPGDRRNCAKCHVNNSNQLPLPEGLLATITPRGFFSPTPPTAAACLACHDTITAASHAFVNIAPFGEGCAACHGEGREFAVSRIHAR